MDAEQPDPAVFHFLDLVGLHSLTQLYDAHARGQRELLAYLTRLRRDAYPLSVVLSCQAHLRQSFPWLEALLAPDSLKNGDWVYLFAWLDTCQQRIGTWHRVPPLVRLHGPETSEIFRWLSGEEEG